MTPAPAHIECTPPERAIAVACDDFGLHPDIDRAALHLARGGRVQAIGCLVRGPSWPRHARWLKALDPACVDIGLHLDLSPKAPGVFKPPALLRFILRALARRLDPEALRRKISSQLAAFEQQMGRPPAYVDGHQHVHQLPQVREALVGELCSRWPDGHAPRPWVRSTRRPLGAGFAPAGVVAGTKAWVIEHLGAAGLAALAARHGVLQNCHLLGVYTFDADPLRHARRMALWLQQAQHGDLLMCHPAATPPKGSAATADGTASAPLGAARYMEAQWLAGPLFEKACRESRVVLRPLSQVLHGGSMLSADAGNRSAQRALAASQGQTPPQA